MMKWPSRRLLSILKSTSAVISQLANHGLRAGSDQINSGNSGKNATFIILDVGPMRDSGESWYLL